MQTVATGLLVTACIANEDYSGALGDGIQVRRCSGFEVKVLGFSFVSDAFVGSWEYMMCLGAASR